MTSELLERHIGKYSIQRKWNCPRKLTLKYKQHYFVLCMQTVSYVFGRIYSLACFLHIFINFFAANLFLIINGPDKNNRRKGYFTYIIFFIIRIQNLGLNYVLVYGNQILVTTLTDFCFVLRHFEMLIIHSKDGFHNLWSS